MQLRSRAAPGQEQAPSARTWLRMFEVSRTLLKSIPEVWEILDDQELIGRLSAELFGSSAIEVVERNPSRRLAWRVLGSPEARVEFVLAEKDWGTLVAIRVGQNGGGEGLRGVVLDRLLDELGSDQRRHVAARKWAPGPEAGAVPDQAGGGALGAPAENAARPRPPDLDDLSRLIVQRVCEEIARAVRAVEDRLIEAEGRLHSEVNQAQRAARERFEETQRELPEGERQRELALAQQGLDATIRAAEQRLAKRAAEIFARFEREVGRLQERARRAVATRASKELDRHLDKAVEPALRRIEERLTATVRASADASSIDARGASSAETSQAGDVPDVIGAIRN